MAKKKTKLCQIKKMSDEKELAECTFSPTPRCSSRSISRSISRSKIEKSIKENNSNNMSFISTPQSNDHYYEYAEQNSKLPQQKPPSLYRKIAPFQVNVSFKCGIDLKSFLKRAK